MEGLRAYSVPLIIHILNMPIRLGGSCAPRGMAISKFYLIPWGLREYRWTKECTMVFNLRLFFTVQKDTRAFNFGSNERLTKSPIMLQSGLFWVLESVYCLPGFGFMQVYHQS